MPTSWCRFNPVGIPHRHLTTTGESLGYAAKHDIAGRKRTRIMLTTAHLDHTPEHNDPANLRALCCRCHLLHDAQHHRQSAWRHRRADKAWGDLFDRLDPPC